MCFFILFLYFLRLLAVGEDCIGGGLGSIGVGGRGAGSWTYCWRRLDQWSLEMGREGERDWCADIHF